MDWSNIFATLVASMIGGLVATSIARRQINATMQVERDKSRREVALELLESVDSYVHIAYRGGAEERLERQETVQISV